MDLFEEDIIAFFELLQKHSVKYMLVGGLAVNIHGFSRTTGDIDLWMDESKENRERFVSALKEKKVDGCEAFLTYPLLAGFAEILISNGIYIDLMSDLQFFKQNNFNDCYALAKNFELKENVVIKILHINHLIEEKSNSNREKDKEDARQLKELLRK